jgi:hypothetical protein
MVVPKAPRHTAENKWPFFSSFCSVSGQSEKRSAFPLRDIPRVRHVQCTAFDLEGEAPLISISSAYNVMGERRGLPRLSQPNC